MKAMPKPGCFVQTVEENKLFYTPREVNRAKRARELLIASGSPSTADLKVAIATNAIANNPVVTEDITLAENIFGKDVGTLKGKQVEVTTEGFAPYRDTTRDWNYKRLMGTIHQCDAREENPFSYLHLRGTILPHSHPDEGSHCSRTLCHH